MMSSGRGLAWHVSYFSLSWWGAAAHITSHWASIRKRKKVNAGLGLLAPLLVHMCVVYAIASVSVFVHARVQARG